MTALTLFLWFLVLILQNAAFTWVSRARNSGSLAYHAVASVFSNGIFFFTNFYLIYTVSKSADTDVWTALGLAAVYICGTVTGSVTMHYVSMRWLEKGKRKVGS